MVEKAGARGQRQEARGGGREPSAKLQGVSLLHRASAPISRPESKILWQKRRPKGSTIIRMIVQRVRNTALLKGIETVGAK